MTRPLIVEQLEERIAPTVINAGETFVFTDGDGDEITIAYFGPDGSHIDATDDGGLDIDNGDDIGWLTASGGDHTSALAVYVSGGAGDSDIAITHGVRSLDAGAPFGVVMLGLYGDTPAGDVVLSTGAEINFDGTLGTLMLNGDINFDTAGHRVISSGDIGFVYVQGDMTLDPVDGAYIEAGSTYGNSDVSVVRVAGDIYTENGGPLLTPEHLVSGETSTRIYDDYGAGTSGYLTVKLGGTATTADIYAIPMVGGGFVLSEVEISDGASLAVTAYGTGGDVGAIVSAGAIGTVTVSGAADADLYLVQGDSIGSVANNTAGGDIVSLVATGSIGSIKTASTGVLGSMLTGAGNYYPMLATEHDTSAIHRFGIVADSIGSITAGSIYATDIAVSGSIGSVKALPGGISAASLDAGGYIGSIQAGYIRTTDIFGHDYIGSVKIGSAGVYDSSIVSHGNIGLVQTAGPIAASFISTMYTDADLAYGGSIGTLQAGSLFGSTVESFGGFGKVAVKGQIADSTVDALFTDLSGTVGGGIGSLSAGGMSENSTVEALAIGSASIGIGGMADTSTLLADTTIAKVSVKGDVTRGSLISAGTGISSVTISGDLAYGGRVESNGYLTSIVVGGQMNFGAIVDVDGSCNAFNVKGGMTGFGCEVDIAGNVGSFMVGGMSGQDVLDSGEDTLNLFVVIHGNVSKFAVNGGISNAGVLIEGSAASVSVAGSVSKGVLFVQGDVANLSVKGDMNHSALTLGADGSPATIGNVTIGGGLAGCNNAYPIHVYGDVSKFSVRGSTVASQFIFDDDVASMSFGRGFYNSAMLVSGAAGKVTIGTGVDFSTVVFYGGVSECAVKGGIYYSDVSTILYDDVTKLPSGGAIGKLSAQDITGGDVSAYGGIGLLAVKGTLYDATIETVGRDNDGAGDIVGGAGIGAITAKGLTATSIAAYTNIGAMTLGDEGVGFGSTIETVTGDLASIATKGLIFGHITVARDVTGSILTAGLDAVSLGGDVDYYFRDAAGMLTGGTLTVTGAIGGTIS